uniref:Glu/Leu/Phe/Val dehydrogenase putative n=1 Tax=Albugo laibachii Nc14 TaxID=890382 RepID=F0WU22_9STRA|nr:Glu/Leu/Phe/Val dehydrogenase putative [Albugo laibachii Nc14]CCA24951.1 NADspecific glutamate dehydrogenase putative [Albugo laibachii Nc14]|eukprot:CCA24951.1 NADspecific glutamate dehydrogenase putative [Albugo laibachii Nc14]
MPAAYFRAIGQEERLQHLNAVTALVHAEQPEVMLRSADHKVYSYIRTGANHPKVLPNVLAQLPKSIKGGAELARVKIFTSLDDTMGLEIFRYGFQEPFTATTDQEKSAYASIQEFCAKIQSGAFKGKEYYPEPAAYFESDRVDEFLNRCNSMYVCFSNPRRIAAQMALFNRVRGTEGVVVDIEHGWQARSEENKLSGGTLPQTMLTIAGANVVAKSMIQKAATYLALCNLNVIRAHLDIVNDHKAGNGHVAMIRILVTPHKESSEEPNWDQIVSDLQYLKWIDDQPIELSRKHPHVQLRSSEVIYAYANMLHGMLAKKDPFAYSLDRIGTVVTHPQQLPIAIVIADFFLRKFDPKQPKLSTSEIQDRAKALRAEIRSNVEAEDAIMLLNMMVDAVVGTLRTNRFVQSRYALALRMDPTIVGYGTVGKDTPFGVFYVYGRRFKGFHVRFRNIARGGLRVVYPSSKDAHALESARQYNEAYNLAFAQQLKNKDIPEGGSKAVVLCDPIVGLSGDSGLRDFVIRKSIKAFTDALLDLNTTDMDVRNRIVDYYEREELIYLGPDENIIPSDITWMTKRAASRGYPIPRAFISSKPDAGINHKTYGVTSEGVAVFADVALRSQNIDPVSQPFTVKITGGTDGDVAGNIIKILHRQYSKNVRVVGICDGTGSLENSDGLDMEELLRLVEASQPLAAYQAEKLGMNGVFSSADTPQGIRARNSMHNRIESDLFIPAGGRPNTINENNWREYLTPSGKPSCKLIVEGANLFITPEARQLLFDHAGVVIVKDSSANKCGVICSSYEIIASMLLETEEFLQVKSELVAQVVAKLRQLACVEAELLFREYKKNPNVALPPCSERISRAIIRVHDAILEAFDSLPSDDQKVLMALIQEHLPLKLQELALTRVESNVPRAYLKCIVASSLASKIVYREGLQYTEDLPQNNLANLALQYFKQEKRVRQLIDNLNRSNTDQKEEIEDLLLRGGVRAGIDRAV